MAIRLFKASQWECGGARLSPLPCPPTGTDGHPRSSLISLQSGNDPCSWDVAALFKYDARCSPTFSMSSHCPRKLGGQKEKEREREHNIPQRSMCCGILFSFSLFVFCFLSFSEHSSSSSGTPNWERDIAGDLRWPRPWEVMQLRFKDLTQSIPQPYRRMPQ